MTEKKIAELVAESCGLAEEARVRCKRRLDIKQELLDGGVKEWQIIKMHQDYVKPKQEFRKVTRFELMIID